MDEILKCDYSTESYRVVLSCGIDYYAVKGGSNRCLKASVDEILKCDYSTESYRVVLSCGIVYCSSFLLCG